MKIGLLGYGKMGRAIEKRAVERGHEIVWAVGGGAERAAFSAKKLALADVVVEFSKPESAFENVLFCLENGAPVVSGTTGWNEKLAEAKRHCRDLEGAFFWASNFSVGVNLFFEINKKLADLMQKWPDYKPSMLEIHHVHKLDAPSGTAISLAEQIIERSEKVEKWSLENAPRSLPIDHRREGEVPGTHSIFWRSPIDQIEIRHEAFSRAGFADGAVLAAEFLIDKTGFFGMRDLLELG